MIEFGKSSQHWCLLGLEIRNKNDLSQVTKYLKLNETVQACVSDIFWWVTFFKKYKCTLSLKMWDR